MTSFVKQCDFGVANRYCQIGTAEHECAFAVQNEMLAIARVKTACACPADMLSSIKCTGLCFSHKQVSSGGGVFQG